MMFSNERRNVDSNRYIERRNAAASNESVTRTAERTVRLPRSELHKQRHTIRPNSLL
jgi:hypothetical protein